MTLFRVPLLSEQQIFNVVLNAIEYTFLLKYYDVDEGGWVLDISDNNGDPLVCGIPLVTGCDLIEPFRYLGIGADNTALFMYTDGSAWTPPTYTNLGSESNMYYEVSDGA